MLSWLALITAGDRAQRQRIFSHQGFLFVLILLVAWTGVSAVWAESPAAALDAATRYLPNAFLFLIVFAGVRTREQLVWVLASFVLGALMSAAYGMVSPAPEGDIGRLSGAGGDANETAAAFVAGGILAAALFAAMRGRPIMRVGAAFAVPFCGLAVFLTLSRGGLIALGASLIAAVLMGGQASRRRARRRAVRGGHHGRLLRLPGAGRGGGARHRARRRHRARGHLEGRLAHGGGRAAARHRRRQLPDRRRSTTCSSRARSCATTSSSTSRRSPTTPIWACSPSWASSASRCSWGWSCSRWSARCAPPNSQSARGPADRGPRAGAVRGAHRPAGRGLLRLTRVQQAALAADGPLPGDARAQPALGGGRPGPGTCSRPPLNTLAQGLRGTSR